MFKTGMKAGAKAMYDSAKTSSGRAGLRKSASSGLSSGVLAMAKRPGYTAAGLGGGVGIAALVTSSGRSSDPRAPMGNSAGLYKY